MSQILTSLRPQRCMYSRLLHIYVVADTFVLCVRPECHSQQNSHNNSTPTTVDGHTAQDDDMGLWIFGGERTYHKSNETHNPLGVLGT